MIFVNVAAYRDPEVVPTIADLFRKARHPDQIDVAVVSQTLASDGITIDHPRVRVVHLDAAQARGPCYARALGYREWSGQLYALQIDSHMRFAPDWDARMLDQLALCASPKSLLTTYPEGYVPPDTLLGDRPAFLAAKQFDGRGALILQGRVEPPPARPRPTAFIAAGFLFGGSDWIREVPYDPHLYFHGEEATLAARLGPVDGTSSDQSSVCCGISINSAAACTGRMPGTGMRLIGARWRACGSCCGWSRCRVTRGPTSAVSI